MKYQRIKHGQAADETWFEEGCWIQEWSNHSDDPGCSIARARVPAGAGTRWHRLDGIIERYVILTGHGTVEIAPNGDPDTLVERAKVGPGDVVLIPAGAGQRIEADQQDLVFLAICTPRFVLDRYQDIERQH